MQNLTSSGGSQNNSPVIFEGYSISKNEFRQTTQANSRPKVNKLVATGVIFLTGLMATGLRELEIRDSLLHGHTFIQPVSKVQQPVFSSIGTSEKLERIRKQLGVSLANLANLLDISRSTLYSWLDEEQILQDATRLRLERLVQRSQMWAELSPHTPGVLLKSREYNGKTLEAWLQETDISDEVLKTYMMDVAIRAKAQAERLPRAITPSASLATLVLDRLSMPENPDG